MSNKLRAPKLLGEKGEQQACNYLIEHGYQILERNFRYKKLEIDIIAKDLTENEIVFVEVKLRSKAEWGSPAQAVDQRKLARLVAGAKIYLSQKRLNSRFRFDIISISLLPQKMEHFKNVTAEW